MFDSLGTKGESNLTRLIFKTKGNPKLRVAICLKLEAKLEATVSCMVWNWCDGFEANPHKSFFSSSWMTCFFVEKAAAYFMVTDKSLQVWTYPHLAKICNEHKKENAGL